MTISSEGQRQTRERFLGEESPAFVARAPIARAQPLYSHSLQTTSLTLSPYHTTVPRTRSACPYLLACPPQAAHAKGLLNTKCLWLHDGAFGQVLKECCYAKMKSSAAALRQLEAVFSELGFPLGDKGVPVLTKVFQEIYERDVMTEDTLRAWREDIHNTTPGHDKALLQTQPWFEWLDNAEEEENDDDDGEGGADAGEPSALAGIVLPDNKRILR